MQWGGWDWRCGLLVVECLQSILCLAVTYYIFLSVRLMIKHWSEWTYTKNPVWLLFKAKIYFSERLCKVVEHLCTVKYTQLYVTSHILNINVIFFFEKYPSQTWRLWSVHLHKLDVMTKFAGPVLKVRCNWPMKRDRSPRGQWWSGAQGSGSSETQSFWFEWSSCSAHTLAQGWHFRAEYILTRKWKRSICRSLKNMWVIFCY